MNNEDRELLEMAAKAAGYDTSHPWNAERLLLEPQVIGLHILRVSTNWNPLDEDSHALRLAVNLRLSIDVDEFMPQTTVSRSPIRNVRYISLDEQHNQDPYAATRRAIVRAAAEIGKTLK